MIPEHWELLKVDDIKSKEKKAIISGPFGSNIGKRFFVESGVPVIRGNNLTTDMRRFIDEGFVFVTPEKAEELNTWALVNDIIFTAAGTLGQVGIIEKNSKFEKYIISNKQLRLRVNEKKIYPLYSFYWFASPVVTKLIVNHNTGSTVPLINLSVLKNLPIAVPPLKIQDFIVNILSSLDDKIELNRKINQTLEAMAQAIFKSWFVDFEPVKAKMAAIEAGEDAKGVNRAAMSAISGKTDEELDHLQAEQPEHYTQLKNTAELFPTAMQDSELGDIPEGWEVIPFSKLAKLDTTSVKPHEEPSRLWEHYSIPAFDVYEAPVLELGSEIKSNKYKVNPTSILSSKLNPNTPRTWWPDVEYETSAICSTEFMQFIPTDESQRAFIFGLITSDPFQSGIKQRVTGSTGSRQRAQPSAVAEMDVVKPKEELVLAYCLHLTALFVLKAKNIKENITLAKFRDTLLPKLLSGELSVDAAKLAEE